MYKVIKVLCKVNIKLILLKIWREPQISYPKLLQISINPVHEVVNQINIYNGVWRSNKDFPKILDLHSMLTWISMWSSTSSWKHSRRYWLEICHLQSLMHDVILSSIAPPNHTIILPYNQVMNTFCSCILLLEKSQNLSDSIGRFCTILLLFVSTIWHILPRLFLSCIWCLFPNTYHMQCQFCRR